MNSQSIDLRQTVFWIYCFTWVSTSSFCNIQLINFHFRPIMLNLTRSLTKLAFRVHEHTVFLMTVQSFKSGSRVVDLKQVSQQAEALAVLAKHSNVRLQLCRNLPKGLLDAIPDARKSDQSESLVEVKSSLLRILMRNDDFNLRVAS